MLKFYVKYSIGNNDFLLSDFQKNAREFETFEDAKMAIVEDMIKDKYWVRTDYQILQLVSEIWT